MNTKIICTLTISFILSVAVFGQTNPPPMAMPADSSVLLVDKIIEVTYHEIYFVDYCTKKVKKYAEENNWTEDKKNEILKSIKFKYYSSTIYNSYAFYSIDQLKILLDTMTLLNKNPKNNLTMVLTNSMMQSNLDGFVGLVIKGKYVTNN